MMKEDNQPRLDLRTTRIMFVISCCMIYLGNALAVIGINLLQPLLYTAEKNSYIVAAEHAYIEYLKHLIAFVIPAIIAHTYLCPIAKALIKDSNHWHAQKRLLNAPIVVGVLSMLGWVLGTLVTLVGIFYNNVGFDPWSYLSYMTVMLITGSFCFVFSYYSFEFLSRRFLIPFFFPDCILSKSNAKMNLSLKARFFVFYFAVGLFPLFLLLRISLTFSTSESISSIFYLTMLLIVLLISGIFLTFLLAKSYENPLLEMKHSVERIIKKDFGFRTRVVSKDEMGLLGEGLNFMARELDEKKSIIDSLQYAKMIQKSLLPNWESISDQLPNSFVIWQPRDIVGGDLIFLKHFGNSFLVCVMDCTGHGVPGALLTMLAASGVRKITIEDRCHDPAAILKRLNKYVKTSLQQHTHHSESDDGLDAAVCYVDQKERNLVYAGARLKILISEKGVGRIVKGDRQSLGYRKAQLDYGFTNHSFDLKPDMSFYLYTDGITDQLDAQRKTSFGNRRLLRTIENGSGLAFSEQRQRILEAFVQFKGDETVRDDITVFGFQPNV